MQNILSAGQRKQLRNLESQLNIATKRNDYQNAKSLFLNIQAILKATGNFERLALSENKLYALAIELSDLDFAINGLLSNRLLLFPETMVYLESVSLLAIAYLRKLEILKAKPYIEEVLTNEIAISSTKKRMLWRQKMLDRFKYEVTINTLRYNYDSVYNEIEMEKEIERLLHHNSKEELYEEIGAATPDYTRQMFLWLNNYSSMSGVFNDSLPEEPVPSMKNKEAGVTFFSSVKKVLYQSLCSSESEIYKAWFNNGMKLVLSKGYIKAVITSFLINLGIGLSLLVASVVALIMKFGIEVYCEQFKYWE
jgi:hypothetical protein